MGALVGGIIALIIGLIGLIWWWNYFIEFLLAIIPLGLILGGALATYLGIEEWRDTAGRGENLDIPEAPGEDARSEMEKYKAEAEKLKAELEALKASQEGTPKE
jgi:hypothetical protein